MRVLITGAGGQVARALVARVPSDVECFAEDRQTCDITEPRSVERCLSTHQPQIVINTAAYTAVDQAETDRERAFAVNAHAVESLAGVCADRGIRLIHLSTDFVFDGMRSTPYRANDQPLPLSAYGESKLAGERAVAACSGLDWLIVRTAWVYASEGRNFLLTMLRLFHERARVNVVSDQVGTPTSALSLARCLWNAVCDSGPPAILHYTDAGVASWYDFAVAIYEEARALGLLDRNVDIVPISTDEYPTPARRPSSSILEKQPTLQRLGIAPVHWRTALREVMREINR